MDLAYFRIPGGNFGDDLNGWLWDELLPGWRDWDSGATLVGVGTVLQEGFLPSDSRKLVLGSGVGYGELPDIRSTKDDWDIRALRGPLSAKALGVPTELGIVDPAMMVSRFARFRDVPKTAEVIFIPHHATRLLDWQTVCERIGIAFVEPAGDCETIIRRIAGARLVIAESMHAAIFADAFRIPWHCVALSRGFNAFKWQDWAHSLDIDAKIHRFLSPFRTFQDRFVPLPDMAERRVMAEEREAKVTGASVGPSRLSSKLLNGLAERFLRGLLRREGQLSDDAVLARQLDRYEQVLREVRKDYGAD